MSYDLNSLECPFCRNAGDGTVYIESKELLDKHFDKKLPLEMECQKCGASAEKVVGCCRLRYVWSRKRSVEEIYRDVSRFECSDCGEHYYAKIVNRGSGYEIGGRMKAPPSKIKVRRQRMLCGGCQGKGGKGDLLNDLIRGQRAQDTLNDLMR